MEQVIVDYLKHLDIPISETYCKKVILSHPDYPSLLSVSDSLDQLGVPCQIGKIEENHLCKVEFPFLLHLDTAKDGLVLIKDQKDLSKDHIDLKEWKGIVLKAESVEELKDSHHNQKYNKERITKNAALVLAISIFAAFTILTLVSFSWINLMLLTTSILGASVGYILIAKDLGITYKPVESFCNTSTRVNCDKVLRSEGAQIVSFFSLSEAVISYFVFQLIITGLLLPILNSPASYLWVLATISVFSIPIIFYSVHYQAAKAKTWCRLCMLVNAVLTLQAGVLGFLYVDGVFSISEIEVMPFFLSLFLYSAIVALVVLIKDKFESMSEAVNAEIAALRVKHAPEVFSHLLVQGNKVDYSRNEYSMVIGNPNAPINLLMVANLNCHPCKTGLKQVLKLVDQYPEQVNVSFKFLMSGNTVHDIPVSSFLINYWSQFISGTQDESNKTRKLIKDWYEYMSTEEFESIYTESLDENESAIVSHYQWIAKHKIVRTPTFFVNGYELPAQYRISDLSSLLTGMIPIFDEETKALNKPKELV
jgi:uncharacterized membrane protein/thiol-disulfide isomerase/thioredoxin